MDLQKIKNLLNDNIDKVFAELSVEKETFGITYIVNAPCMNQAII